MHTGNTEIPSNKFLGKLCRNGHDWNGTGKSLRYINGKIQRCVQCESERKRSEESKKQRNARFRERYNSDPALRARISAQRKAIRVATDYKYSREYSRRPDVREKANEYKRQRRIRLGGLSKQDRQAEFDMRKVTRHLEKLKVLTVADLICAEQERYDRRENAKFGLLLYNRQKAKLRKAIERDCAHFGNISRSEMIKRWSVFDCSCAYCGHKPVNPAELEVEHVVPISQGGPHTLSNIVPACNACNRSKSKHDMTKWYRKQPFYDKTKEKRIKEVLSLTPYPERQLELLHHWQVAS